MIRRDRVRSLDPSRTITVVSGLPRSGTSMMMQMLEAAGLPLATDGQRIADPHNPRGYYELDRVKRLKEDSTFLKSVVGKAVKVVTPLIPFLPSDYDYRVISMQRELDEILRSQRAMLKGRRSGNVGPTEEVELARAYRRQIENVNHWLARQENIRVCFVAHRLALGSPSKIGVAVSAFLEATGAFSATLNGSENRELAWSRMAEAIDPLLHRQRGVL